MKKLTAKQNMTIANVLMGAGVVYNLWDLLVNGYELKPVPVIVSVALVAIGAVYSAVFVKCPHCGDKLKGLKNKLPDNCPVCGKPLDKLPQ